MLGILLVVVGLIVTSIGFISVTEILTIDSVPVQYGWENPMNVVILVVGLEVLAAGLYLFFKSKKDDVMEKNKMIGILLIGIGPIVAVIGLIWGIMTGQSYPPIYVYQNPTVIGIILIGLAIFAIGLYLYFKAKNK